jgi:leucyl/phenylalanyl-tRNA--protein transferase
VSRRAPRRVFFLDERLVFPPPSRAGPDGLLAVGGDLGVERLLLAYRSGIFPWPHEDYPFIWCSPDPRFVLYPGRLKVPKSLARVLRSSRYRITADRDFAGVIRGCRAAPRPGQEGTWILPEMVAAYEALHAAGYAHSVEAWLGDELAGGLYGVSLGNVFFGESMFALRPDASKCAFVRLVEVLRARGFEMIDSQAPTAHLTRFGAESIPRARFLAELDRALEAETRAGDWGPCFAAALASLPA